MRARDKEVLMRVYQINVVNGVGSTGRIVNDLQEYLVKRGDQCRIAYGRGKSCVESDCSIRISTKAGVYIDAFLTRLTDRAGRYSVSATKKLINDLKKYKPDIVHLHNIHGYYLNIKLLFDYLKKADIPVIWTLHDCWSFTGHCVHFDMIECSKWETMCNKCPQKSDYPTSIFLDNSQNNYLFKKELFNSISNLTFVTPSKWLKNVVSQSFFCNHQIEVVYNGIDCNIFKPVESNFKERYSIEGKKMILGVASVWDERKGLDTFVELSNLLDDSYVVVLVGLSSKQAKNVPSKIITIERTNDTRELAQIYSAADVFVNTSVEETMGLTTVEAMSCGTPVIVMNATAIPEVVGEKCGVVVEKGKINDLVEAIKTTVNQKINVSNVCREWAMTNYEKSLQYEKYYMLYKSILEDKLR